MSCIDSFMPVSRSTPTKFPRSCASLRLKTCGHVKIVIRKVALEVAVTDISTSEPSAKAGGLMASVTAIEGDGIDTFESGLSSLLGWKDACVGWTSRCVLTVWCSCCKFVWVCAVGLIVVVCADGAREKARKIGIAR
jgi:hypothetical protein